MRVAPPNPSALTVAGASYPGYTRQRQNKSETMNICEQDSRLDESQAATNNDDKKTVKDYHHDNASLHR